VLSMSPVPPEMYDESLLQKVVSLNKGGATAAAMLALTSSSLYLPHGLEQLGLGQVAHFAVLCRLYQNHYTHCLVSF
jgi:hypothetical protein